MNRRVLLRYAAAGALLAVAGCFGIMNRIGSNETLEIQNEYSDPVALRLTIEEGLVPDERSIVFGDEVSVPANQTTSLEVLGNNQYYLTVQMGDQTHEFGTRPICADAYTTIIITADREIRSEIRDCE